MKTALFKKRGFTLIELLVVIAIIGMLSSIVLASLNTARAKSRDARRLSDINQITKALEFHYDDNNTYAISGSGSSGGGQGWFNYDYPGYPSVGERLSTLEYTPSEIIDPTGSPTGPYSYMIRANGAKYTLWARLENPTAEHSATLNNCYFSSYDSGYAMNYCVSN